MLLELVCEILHSKEKEMEPDFNLLLGAVQGPQTPKGRPSADKGVRLGVGREVSVRAETLQLFPRKSTELCWRMDRQPLSAGDRELNLLCAHAGRKIHGKWSSSQHFSLVAQSCPILCEPMDCSTPGFSVLPHLPEFAKTHVHRVSDVIQPSNPLSSPSPPAFNLSQHQGLF